MKKRYNYRAYPTARQEQALARLFGCCRVVFNETILTRQRAFEAGLPMTSSEVQSFVITYAKAHHQPWFAEVASGPLIQAKADADTAYSNWFASRAGTRKGPKVGFPRLKTKHSGARSARFVMSRDAVRVTDLGGGHATLRLPKIGQVRFRLSRPLPSAPSSVTITRASDGAYKVSFVVDVRPVEIQVANPDRHAGLDVGLNDFAAIVCSDGTREKISNPRHLRQAERRLRRQQRALSRKQGPDRRTGQQPSNNWRKQQAVVARTHTRVKDTRTEFQHTLVLRLARENQTCSVEALNTRGLVRSGAHNAQGRGLRRAMHDAAWGAFLHLLSDVMQDRCVSVNPAGTSQVCSQCGYLPAKRKGLGVRIWTCAGCGAVLDRDYNAATNILTLGGQAHGTAGRAEPGRQSVESLWSSQALATVSAVAKPAPALPVALKQEPTGPAAGMAA